MTDYPTSARPQAGFEEVGGGVMGVAPLGVAAHPSPATPSPTPEDFDARLRAAVTRLRWQQPEEFDVFSRMAQIEKQLADVLAIVELQSEVILGISKKAAL